MNKVLVIGMDGATLDLVEPWARQGKLPVMAGLMARGSYARLRSVMPVLSSAAWPSFMTGMNPGKHGMYDFVQRDLSTYRLRIVHREHIRAASLWKILSQQGRKVGVINVPMTYPPEEVNGFIVTGLGTPEFKIFTYPAELSKELLQRNYQVNKHITFQPGKEAEYLKEVHTLTERQFNAAQWLMQTRDWDFFMTVFFDTDQLAHYYWRYMDPSHPLHKPDVAAPYANAILNFYQKLDHNIGQLVATAGPETNVIIISDHGTGPLYQDVYLNEWLRQQGYLVIESQTAQYTGIHRLLARLGITRRGVAAWLQRNRMGWLENWLTETLGDRVFILPRTQRTEFPVGVDWSRTRAYSFGYQGQIYINLKGREAQGIIEPGEEYERLLEEITTRLMEMKDPQDGKPVVDHIYRKEEIFHGPRSHLAPDLTLIMRGLTYITRYGYENSPQAGKIFTDPTTHESGSHRQEGLLIACGPDILQKGSLPQGAALIDLAPTILYLLGCTVPAEMDGRILEDTFTTGLLPKITGASNDESSISAESTMLTPEEEKELVERLKSMGYLE